MKNDLKNYLFTSESVAPGHPDKICDQISDSIVDLFLEHDKEARVAAETMVTPNVVIIAGETRGPASVSKEMINNLARECIKNIGYEQECFHWNKIKIENYLISQSKDIAIGVDSRSGKEEGAGDQGIMFGYAVDETEDFMPAPLYYANKILKTIGDAIKNKELIGLGPDAKSQVTLHYENYKPIHSTSIVVSIQHVPEYSQAKVKEMIRPYVEKVFPNKEWMCPENEFYVNPTGIFTIGGPEGDSGVTGRKIIVDTYGGAAPHGGGAFSGKDPSKVDRSAAYAARYLAKNVVASGIAKKCTIQISYAIGISKPLSFYVNTHRTSTVDEIKLAKVLNELVNLTPRGIINHLGLRKPIYKPTACYGHFGRTPGSDGSFSWEKIDLIDSLKTLL